jgi:hypothetical protein
VRTSSRSAPWFSKGGGRRLGKSHASIRMIDVFDARVSSAGEWLSDKGGLVRRRVAVLWVVFTVVPLVGFASPGGAGSSITAARQALASVPPHVVALARALAAHPLAASALPAGFRNVGCGLRDHAIPCPVHISPKPDNVVVIYYMLLKRKPGPQNVYLNYRIYATRSVARTAFEQRRHLRGKLGESERNARPTEALKPYPGLLIDELAVFPLPLSASHARCYQPATCWTTRAWALVGNVIVSATAGLGPRTGNAAEAIKLAKAGIRHLLEVERSIK